MIHPAKDLYTGDAYMQLNPDYHLADAGWKSAMIWKIISANKIVPTRITDIGCGAGGVVKALAKLAGKGVSLSGFDVSPAAVAIAKENNPDSIPFFVGDYFSTGSEKDGMLLVIDVLEHLENYPDFLRQLRKRGQFFVLHIPLDLSARAVLKPHILKQQRDSVGHIHYFTKDMVWWFLQDAGFEIIDWTYTKPVSDLNNRGPAWRKLKRVFRNFFFSVSPDLGVKLWGDYSVLILAK